MRESNAEGTCVADEHYMVDITNKLIDKKNLNECYMSTFDFNQHKQIGQAWINVDAGRRILDIRV